MKKRYILLKNSPELKKGAIVEEACDDGDQGFECKDESMLHNDEQSSVFYNRKTVTQNPEWFEEVGVLSVPIRMLSKVQEFLEKKCN